MNTMSARSTRSTILPLALDRLCYSAGGTRLIQDFSTTFAADERTIILGPNGAGKSLLLRLCHGLLKPASGSVTWQGANAGDAARRQAMVFQKPVTLRRSVAANVDYALAIRKVPRPRRREIVLRALQLAGLSELAGRPARVLSAGEQQRLALARAWVLEPEVLFLDEPSANLDPAATRAVESMISSIHNDGAKIIMTTHDLGQARRLADHVVFMHQGRLIEATAAESFFASPATALAKAFLEGELLG